MKRSFLKVYPPDNDYPYPHYRNGLRSWSSFPLSSRISLIVSIIVLIIAYIKWTRGEMWDDVKRRTCHICLGCCSNMRFCNEKNTTRKQDISCMGCICMYFAYGICWMLWILVDNFSMRTDALSQSSFCISLFASIMSALRSSVAYMRAEK